jgi:hypothetical protein
VDSKIGEKKSSKTKSIPAKGLEDEESDLELENELDQENAIEEEFREQVPDEPSEEEVLLSHALLI